MRIASARQAEVVRHEKLYVVRHEKLSSCDAAAIQGVSRSSDLRTEVEISSPRDTDPSELARDSYQGHGSVCACGEPPERSR